MKDPSSVFPSHTLLIVGDIMLDVYYIGEVQRISPEAPVPVLRVMQKTTTLGGAGNVALNVKGLHCAPILIGVRGEDAAGSCLQEILVEKDVSDQLVIDQARSTTSKTRIMAQRQQLLRLDEEQTTCSSENVRAALLMRFIEAVERAEAVIISDYAKGVLTHDVCQMIIRTCRNRGIPVFVDPRGKDWERYEGATCVTPNTNELEIVLGHLVDDDEDLLVQSAEAIISKYSLDGLLVTRGPKGMCLISPGMAPFFVRATAREVFDVSGAGDTVIATFAVGVAAGLPLKEAAEVANAAAGIVVGKLGSQAITLPELQAALRLDTLGSKKIGISKVTTVDAARLQVQAWQASSEAVVYMNGYCLDAPLEPKAIHILQQAKAFGNRLIVGVALSNTDPLGSHRSEDLPYVLSALECVDLVMLYDGAKSHTVVGTLQPNVLVEAGERWAQANTQSKIVESYGGQIRTVAGLG